jgi:hypothetical protein
VKHIFIGEELQQILQNSSNEEYIANKHSEGSNVEIDKEADETRKCISGGRQWQKKREVATA